MRRGGITAVIFAVAVALMISGAQGSEVTRTTYRESVEPICKTNTKANERIFKGVRTEVKQDKLVAAAVQFAKAGRALKRTLSQLRAVPRPAADKARLGKWLGFIEVEVGLFEQVAVKLRAGQKIAAERLVVLLTGNADRANNAVIAFEFKYCRFEPSRFI